MNSSDLISSYTESQRTSSGVRKTDEIRDRIESYENSDETEPLGVVACTATEVRIYRYQLQDGTSAWYLILTLPHTGRRAAIPIEYDHHVHDLCGEHVAHQCNTRGVHRRQATAEFSQKLK